MGITYSSLGSFVIFTLVALYIFLLGMAIGYIIGKMGFYKFIKGFLGND